ncbi:sugar epimerase, partial [candidate division KSB1 bacterium]
MNIFTPPPQKPLLIDGATHIDERGEIRFVNDALLSGIKRFYMISNKAVDIVRAWQAHKIEAKYFFAVDGAFLIGAVKLDDFENPSPDLSAERFILNSDTPQILYIPPGYANGIHALSEKNLMLIFSTLDLNESMADDYRFASHLW